MAVTDAAVSPAGRRSAPSPFLKDLRRAVIDTFEPDIEIVCQMAVLFAIGFKAPEVRTRLGLKLPEFNRVREHLRQAAPQLGWIRLEDL
jgi:hypothetical protein